MANTTTTEPKQRLRELSREVGGGRNPYLFTVQVSSTKLAHNADVTDEYEQIVCYLVPHTMGRKLWQQFVGTRAPWRWRNVCPHSTPGCRATCLADSGRLGMSPAKRAMLARTALFNADESAFWQLAADEIARHRERVARNGKRLVVRVDGTSQVNVEERAPWLLDKFPDVIFQDYAKGPYVTGWSRPNRYVVSSGTERDTADSIAGRGNVVFPVDLPAGAPLPPTYMGRPVVDGDLHDLRILDPQGENVVMVRVKGHRRDRHGFIRQLVG